MRFNKESKINNGDYLKTKVFSNDKPINSLEENNDSQSKNKEENFLGGFGKGFLSNSTKEKIPEIKGDREAISRFLN